MASLAITINSVKYGITATLVGSPIKVDKNTVRTTAQVTYQKGVVTTGGSAGTGNLTGATLNPTTMTGGILFGQEVIDIDHFRAGTVATVKLNVAARLISNLNELIASTDNDALLLLITDI
jgi:hypothetical protein